MKGTSSAPGRAAKTVKSRGLEPQGQDGSAQPNTALAARLEYSEAHSNATRGCGPGGDTVVVA
jgi:hypothetical protein